jgi:hypothetical protein
VITPVVIVALGLYFFFASLGAFQQLHRPGRGRRDIS